MMKLDKHSHVVTAWAECAVGPGWANRIVWFIVADGNGRLRKECLQPEEQSRDMQCYFGFSEMATAKMVAAVCESIDQKKKRRVSALEAKERT